MKLTEKQRKAFASFERAYKKCKNAGIRFYVVLETLMALNAECIKTIHNGERERDLRIDTLNFPSIFDYGFCSWADDPHYVEFKK